MERKKKGLHPLLLILFIFLGLVILVSAFPFLYHLVGDFDDYDDIPALIDSDGVRTLSVDRDGTVSFSADKAVLYSYAAEQGLEQRLLAYIAQLPYCSEDTVRIRAFGYELNGEALSASAELSLFGFIPVQLHADAALTLSPDEIQIRLNALKYGKWIRVPLEKCAELLGVPAIRDGFAINTSGFYGELHPVELSAKDSVISFRCDLLNETVREVGDSGAMLAVLTPILCGEDSDAAKVLRGETSEVYGKIKDPASLSALLTGLLKFGSEADAAERRQALEASPFLGLALGDVSVCASGRSAALCEALRGYESGLVALRDNYKALNYSLAADGLYDADGLPAEAALPEEWGARIVLQYNRDYDSIVKVSDGSLIAGKWVDLPNPSITDLKYDRKSSVPDIPGITVFDLTVALRMADGTPAILFLTAIDELGLNGISEQLYEEILTSEALPVYCASDIISPTTYHFVTPDAAQRNLLCYLP